MGAMDRVTVTVVGKKMVVVVLAPQVLPEPEREVPREMRLYSLCQYSGWLARVCSFSKAHDSLFIHAHEPHFSRIHLGTSHNKTQRDTRHTKCTIGAMVIQLQLQLKAPLPAPAQQSMGVGCAQILWAPEAVPLVGLHTRVA